PDETLAAFVFERQSKRRKIVLPLPGILKVAGALELSVEIPPDIVIQPPPFWLDATKVGEQGRKVDLGVKNICQERLPGGLIGQPLVVEIATTDEDETGRRGRQEVLHVSEEPVELHGPLSLRVQDLHLLRAAARLPFRGIDPRPEFVEFVEDKRDLGRGQADELPLGSGQMNGRMLNVAQNLQE